MIEVVGGILVLESRILMGQRPPGKNFPLTWECPGGKSDGNESHHGTIARELREELALEVLPATNRHVADFEIGNQAVWCGHLEDPTIAPSSVFMLFYRVIAWRGEPTPKEGQGWGWFTKDEFLALGMSPGNRQASKKIAASVWGL